ncbi:MAG TPA: hypothetical protein PLZ60_09960 [Kiritimatiellia bacterium]|nr:hypothetical protein [Kiritimatiellia bacterium]
MRRITRRQAIAWLSPMRRTLREMVDTGAIDAVRGYAVTRLHDGDDYARVDYCCAGFRALINRLWPGIDLAPLARIEKRLAAGLLLERDDLVATLALLNDIEGRLMKKTVREVKDAVLAEQIAIEIEQLGLKEAA